MMNIEEFIKRIEILLEYYSLSASSFAEKLGIQRSGLSHLMSGRNKPSLDFVLKISENFPEVDMYWLLNGDGEFPKGEHANTVAAPLTSHSPLPVNSQPDLFSTEETPVQNIKSNAGTSQKITEATVSDRKDDKGLKNVEIERIVIFYSNGLFKEYKSEN